VPNLADGACAALEPRRAAEGCRASLAGSGSLADPSPAAAPAGFIQAVTTGYQDTRVS